MKRWILTLVCGLGIVWALYGLRADRQVRQGQEPAACSIIATARCDIVLQSPYARWLGVPLPIWALGFYLSMLGVLWGMRSTERRAILVTLGGAMAVFISLGLFWLMQVKLQAVCPICYIGYGINLLLLITGAIVFRPELRRFLTVWRRDRTLRRWVYGVITGLVGLVWVGYPRAPTAFDSPAVSNASFEEPRLCENTAIPPEWETFFASPPSRETVPTHLCNYLAGGPEAPVQIIEFSDFQCPYCAILSDYIHRLLKEFGPQIAVVFCHFPLDTACNPASPPVHPLACQLAMIAECAAMQGRFRVVHDEIFTYQQAIPLWLQGRIPGATPVQSFQACLMSPDVRRRVEQQVSLGQRLGVKATPTLFVNGIRLEGVPPIPVLCRLIQDELARKGR